MRSQQISPISSFFKDPSSPIAIEGCLAHIEEVRSHLYKESTGIYEDFPQNSEEGMKEFAQEIFDCLENVEDKERFITCTAVQLKDAVKTHTVATTAYRVLKELANLFPSDSKDRPEPLLDLVEQIDLETKKMFLTDLPSELLQQGVFPYLSPASLKNVKETSTYLSKIGKPCANLRSMTYAEAKEFFPTKEERESVSFLKIINLKDEEAQEFSIFFPHLRTLEMQNEKNLQNFEFLKNLPLLKKLKLSFSSYGETKKFCEFISGSQFDLTQLEGLRCNVQNDADVESLSKLSKLKELELYAPIPDSKHKGITGAGIKFLATFSELKSFFLMNAQNVQDEDFELLKDLTHLSKLHLINPNFTGSGIRHLSHLTHLELCIYKNMAFDGLCAIKSLEKLRHLCLVDVKQESLKALSEFSELTHLNLRHCNIQDLCFIKNLTKLRTFTLTSWRLSPEFAGWEGFSSLENLNLESCHGNFLKGLENLPKLTNLSIVNSNFAAFAQMECPEDILDNSLKEYFYESSEESNEEPERILENSLEEFFQENSETPIEEHKSRAQGLVNIKSIKCSHINSNDEYIRNFFEWVKKHPNLEKLELNFDGINDKHLRKLIPLVTLKELVFCSKRKHSVTEKGLKNLKDANKDLRVIGLIPHPSENLDTLKG